MERIHKQIQENYHKAFFDLLSNINGDDKRRDIIELCNMHEEMNANGTVQN